jgi:plastocyanin
MKRHALLLLVLPALLAACGSGYSSSKSTTAAPSTVPPTSTGSSSAKMNNHGTANVSGMTSVKVQMNDYFFSPSILHGKPNQKLTINLSNQAAVVHNFSITSQSISQDVQPGKTATVQVTLPKSGVVQFFCRFHRSLGMAGELQTGKTMGSNPTSTGSTTTTSNYGSTGY